MRRKLLNLLGRISSALNAVDSDMHDVEMDKSYAEFKKSRELYYKRDLKNAVIELKQADIRSLGKDNQNAIEALEPLVKQLSDSYDKDNRIAMVDLVARAVSILREVKDTSTFKVTVPQLPGTISSEVSLDVKEMERCFDAGAFRSVTILCGRILEVALHRKYYEVTEQDILETQPGIGLGKLIAKLKEKNVQFDPGVTEQIHLINQVRVSSVHKKREPFSPTREQAHAMVLYTMDVLQRLFSK